jgi:predicted histidine transporter YuiF (NhaC family)
MIDKIKTALSTIKDFIVGLLILAVYAFYTKNKKSQRDLEDEKYRSSMEKTTEEEKAIDEKAKQSYTDYINAKHEYDAGGPKDVS